MELHERIAFVRKAAGLTQEQLGEKLGVTRQAVSKWESNQATPDALTIARLCAELNVSADFVLLGKEPDGSSAAPPPTITCPCCGKEAAQGAPKCQACSYDFFPTPPDDDQRFAVLLQSCGDYDIASPMLMRFTGWDSAQCKQHLDSFLGLTDVRVSQILLRRGLTRSAALHISSCMETCSTTRIVADERIPGTDTPALSDEELLTLSSAISTPKPADEKDGIGFWGIVGAVVVGIIIASFL
jgi:transcriptional regulator with XRE-family HTH domain